MTARLYVDLATTIKEDAEAGNFVLRIFDLLHNSAEPVHESTHASFEEASAMRTQQVAEITAQYEAALAETISRSRKRRRLGAFVWRKRSC